MSVGILVDRDTSWAERWAVTTVFFGSGLGIGAWAASVPTFKDRFALSDGALSIALLAFAAGAVVSMPLTGLLGPKLGAARLILDVAAKAREFAARGRGHFVATTGILEQQPNAANVVPGRCRLG